MNSPILGLLPVQWVFIVMGSATILLSLARPSWYWESRKARNLRGMIGDQGTIGFYFLVGIALILIGVFRVR